MQAGRMIRSMVMLVLGICLFLGLSSGAQASVYIGTFCWQSSHDGTIYEFAINDMGNSHYQINGNAVTPSNILMPLSGNVEAAQVAGNPVLAFTFSGGSFGNFGTQTTSMNWSISLPTGDGTGVGNMTRTNYQGQTTISLIQDALDLIVCP